MDVQYHVPVLAQEVLDLLLTDASKTYIDATVGGGGHAQAICQRLSGSGKLICFDADADAIEFSKATLAPFGDRAMFVHTSFANLNKELVSLQVEEIAGILLDLGVSSFQLDAPAKGFSFRSEGRVDMRMDRRQALSGWDVVNAYPEKTLADVIYRFGEERNSRRIAGKIVAARTIETTQQLGAVVESAVGKRHLTETLARVFQAIRIEVNNELKNLQVALHDAMKHLSPGGRIVVISYHSLEDRIVKEFFKRESRNRIPSENKYVPDQPVIPRLRILTKKPVRPQAAEIALNPRARSAKMRAAERVAAV